MKAIVIASSLLLMTIVAPAASAELDLGAIRCDNDDDLYQECEVEQVYIIYGPGCVGVDVGDRPACAPIPQ